MSSTYISVKSASRT